jgi:uncharacterized protein
MLVDANLLIYARNEGDPRHAEAGSWLQEVLNGPVRIGLPWPSLSTFLRLSTHPRAFGQPLSVDDATDQVLGWLAAPAAWIPLPTSSHAQVLTDLLRRHRVVGPLVSDAVLVALAIEHGVPIASTDSDFARFKEIRWENPLAD